MTLDEARRKLARLMYAEKLHWEQNIGPLPSSEWGRGWRLEQIAAYAPESKRGDAKAIAKASLLKLETEEFLDLLMGNPELFDCIPCWQVAVGAPTDRTAALMQRASSPKPPLDEQGKQRQITKKEQLQSRVKAFFVSHGKSDRYGQWGAGGWSQHDNCTEREARAICADAYARFAAEIAAGDLEVKRRYCEHWYLPGVVKWTDIETLAKGDQP